MDIELKPYELITLDYRTVEGFQGALKDLSEKDYEKLKKSLTSKGKFVPEYIWKDGDSYKLLDGHQRFALYGKENVTFNGGYDVPFLLLDADSEKDAKEKLLLINSQYGKVTKEGFNEFSFDIDTDWILDTTTFDGWLDEDVTEIEPSEESEDVNLDPPKEPVTVLGDLYELNNHRVHCGDSTDVGVVEKTLNGAQPYLMITDPPYGVEYNADWRNNALRADGSAIGGRATGKVENDDKADWTDAWSISPTKVAYVYHAGLFAGVVANSLQNCEYELRSQIIWAKSNFAISRGHYHWKHEPCWYAVKKNNTAKFIGDHSNTTLWEIAKPMKSETGHSTQKPIECMSKPMLNHEGDVYDPFLGSHTTLIAAEQNGRTCYGQELNPAYVDVGVRRWLKFMRDNNKSYTIKRNGKQLTEAELKEFE